jgi:hypothetical protein
LQTQSLQTAPTQQAALNSQHPLKHPCRHSPNNNKENHPPEEDEVALIVEGDHAPAPELRVLVEQAAQHATYAAPQARVEVVEQQLRPVPTDAAVAL